MTAVDTFLVGYHFTTNLQHAISPLGGDYRLAIPLITLISQSWSESTQVLTCSSVVEIDLESPKKYSTIIGFLSQNPMKKRNYTRNWLPILLPCLMPQAGCEWPQI